MVLVFLCFTYLSELVAMESSDCLKTPAIDDELYEIPVIEISESSEAETEYADPILNCQDVSDFEDSESKTVTEFKKVNQIEESVVPGNGICGVSSVEQQEAPSDSSLHTDLFNEFLAECKKYFKFPQDDKIVGKLKKYFTAVDADYKVSTQCVSLLKMFIEQLEDRKNDIYVFVKEILDEFKKQKTNSDWVKNQTDILVKPERIKKLEKYLEVLDRKIKKIQEKEVDLDADNNSDYILECRLKDRFVKVYNLLAKLTGCYKNEASISRRKINFNATRYPEINRDISKRFSKNPEFPDFVTMVQIIKRTNEKESLHLSEVLMHQLAKEAFVEVGEELKRRRQCDFVSNIGCHLTDDIDFDRSDPAATDEALKTKLIQNQQIGKKRLEEVLEKFSSMKELPPSVSDESDNAESEISEQSDENDTEIDEPPEESSDPLKMNSHDPMSRKRDRENLSPPCSYNLIKLKEEPPKKKTHHNNDDDEDIIVLD